MPHHQPSVGDAVNYYPSPQDTIDCGPGPWAAEISSVSGYIVNLSVIVPNGVPSHRTGAVFVPFGHQPPPGGNFCVSRPGG
jgi:hypothetical protein